MTDYLVGDTVVLEAQYFSEGNQLMDPDTTPLCEVHDNRGRVIQTNLIVEKIRTGTFQAYFDTSGLPKGTYFYIFSALFESRPSKQDGSFVLVTA